MRGVCWEVGQQSSQLLEAEVPLSVRKLKTSTKVFEVPWRADKLPQGVPAGWDCTKGNSLWLRLHLVFWDWPSSLHSVPPPRLTGFLFHFPFLLMG